jgi:tetratricopeptide (TPR) repeat protein
VTVGARLRRSWAALDALVRRVKPRDAGDYLSRGFDRQLRGDLAGAISDYAQAIARSSDHHSRAMAFLTLANALEDQGDLAGAVDAYSQAIVHDPGHAGAYLSRGLAYVELGQVREAIADLELVRELTPDPQWRQQAEKQLEALTNTAGIETTD